MGGRGSRSAISYSYSDYSNSVTKWVNSMENVTSEDRKILESFIEDQVKNKGSVKYAYGMSRGMSMSNDQLDNLKIGDEFSEKKLASWSSRVGIAQSFAKNRVTDSRPNKVVIRMKEPSNHAAKLSGVSSRKKYDEGEAIMSSKARFKIVKMKVDKRNYTEIWVESIN